MLTAPRPGILLDRDGTINVDYHYVGHIERLQLIPGTAGAIRRFNEADIPVVVVTNQGGVARGFYPEDNVTDINQRIQRELSLHGAHIDLFYYSPHHPDGNIREYAAESNWHKPNTGMAYAAAQDFNLDLHESWVVGDRISDMEMASRIRANAVYLGAEPLPYYMSHFYRFKSLADAAGLIMERITGVSQSEFPTKSYHGMIDYWIHYTAHISMITTNLSGGDIARAAGLLIKAYDDGGHVFVAGNGGAAALSDHFTCDHVNHMGANKSWYTNIHSLTANIPLLTATANDIGYDSIFSYQLERNSGVHGDIFIAFSVSGNSANIVRALQAAEELGMSTIAVVAMDGGKAAKLADVVIHIPTSNYGLAEDVMQMIMHSMAQFIRTTRMSDMEVQSARF